MNQPRRVFIATVSGMLFGIVCVAIASTSPGPLAWPIVLQIFLSRTLIGVAIGISALSMGHWSIHGLVLGFVFSLPLAFSGLMAPDNPEFSKVSMFLWTVGLGMVYGVLIELITTRFFRAGTRMA
jgi:hypothetical protein